MTGRKRVPYPKRKGQLWTKAEWEALQDVLDAEAAATEKKVTK